jgi:hypothetical protein
MMASAILVRLGRAILALRVLASPVLPRSLLPGLLLN